MTLVLDVVSNVDYSKIEAEVQKIRENLAKIPDKVKINIQVGIDQSATQQIQNLQRDIERAVNANGATASIRGIANNVKAVSQSISGMGKDSTYALRDQIDAITGVSTVTKSAKDSADSMRMSWAMASQEAKASADAEKLLAESDAQRAEAANKATYALRDQIDAITGVNNASRSAKDSARNMREEWVLQSEQIRKYNSSLNTLSNAEQNLRNWSKMKYSADAGVRNKYQSFEAAVSGLRQAAAAYDGTTESALRLNTAAEDVTRTMQKTQSAGYEAGLLEKGFKTQVGDIVRYYGAMLTGIQGFQLAIKATEKLASEAIAINDSMTQLRIVTNESDEAFKQYGDDVAKTAQKIGSSITDVIDATTVFARLGYSLKDSSTLAELTAMLQRVGDIEATDAQASLTSIIKAFDIDVSDMESVMDKLVTVGNGFPISVSEIASGMMNASSALAAAGNSFDKSVALLAAANTTLQDANKSSTGLRTITARIRKTDSELNDLGEAMTESAYEDLVGALTKYNVSLRDANGEYRDTYDIMKDIAAVWNEMTSSEQAALAELAAGNRQQTVFYSIIKNFDSVAAASMEAMDNAGGAMQDAYGEWMDSITAHIETFKAAFEGLANDLIQSDLLTGLIDIGTWFINIADTVVKLNDNLGTTALTIGSIVAVLNSIKSIS